jgi:hypothetical protein
VTRKRSQPSQFRESRSCATCGARLPKSVAGFCEQCVSWLAIARALAEFRRKLS